MATTSTHGVLGLRDVDVQLGRVAPSPGLAALVERHRLVTWGLRPGRVGSVTLLPHPCVNLVLDGRAPHGRGRRDQPVHLPLPGHGPGVGPLRRRARRGRRGVPARPPVAGPDPNVELVARIVAALLHDRSVTGVDDVSARLGMGSRSLQRLFRRDRADASAYVRACRARGAAW